MWVQNLGVLENSPTRTLKARVPCEQQLNMGQLFLRDGQMMFGRVGQQGVMQVILEKLVGTTGRILFSLQKGRAPWHGFAPTKGPVPWKASKFWWCPGIFLLAFKIWGRRCKSRTRPCPYLQQVSKGEQPLAC